MTFNELKKSHSVHLGGIQETLLRSAASSRELLSATERALCVAAGNDVEPEQIRNTLDAIRPIADITARVRVREVFEAASGPDRRRAVDAVIALGDHLHSLSLFLAAADCQRVAMQLAESCESQYMRAALRCSFALRLARRLEQAEAIYRTLRDCGNATKNRQMILEGDLGLAKLSADRGNYPAAEVELDDIIVRARRIGDWTLLGRALTSASRVAGVRLKPVRVVQLAFESLSYLAEPRDQDHAYHNIAVAQRELGDLDMAQIVARHLSRVGVEVEARLSALLLLLNIAIDRGADPSPQIAALTRITLPPVKQAEYYEALARQRASEHDFVAAEHCVEQLRAFAEREEIAEMAARAERAACDLRRGVVPAIYVYRPVAIEPAAQHTLEPINLALSRICCV